MPRIKIIEIEALLLAHGLTARRTNTAGPESWTLSNGETYASLKDIYEAYIDREPHKRTVISEFKPK